jgi:signal peptidase II
MDPEPPGAPEAPASTRVEDGDELPPGERASTLLLVIVAFVSCAADLATKAWAHARLAGVDGKRGGAKSITLIEGHLDFIFAQNPGGAWSFARGLPEGLRRPFFLFISAAAIVFIVSIYRRVHRDQTAMKWGLPLALGGAIGNLVDRIRYGWVIDFIDMYTVRGGREHHWPTYNVADVAIVAGVLLMGFSMISASRRARLEERRAREAMAAAAPGPSIVPAGEAVPLLSPGEAAAPAGPPDPPPAA